MQQQSSATSEQRPVAYTRAYICRCVWVCGRCCWLRGNERMIDRSIDRRSRCLLLPSSTSHHTFEFERLISISIRIPQSTSTIPHHIRDIDIDINIDTYPSIDINNTASHSRSRDIPQSISTILHLIRDRSIDIDIDIHNTASHLSSGDIDIAFDIHNTASHSRSIDRYRYRYPQYRISFEFDR